MLRQATLIVLATLGTLVPVIPGATAISIAKSEQDGNTRPPTMEDIRFALKARDLAIPSLAYAFDTVLVDLNDRSESNIFTRWTGKWWKQGQSEAVEWVKHAKNREGKIVETSAKHSSWDGSRRYEYTEDRLDKSRHLTKSDARSGAFLEWLPIEFGLGRGGKWWSDLLKLGTASIIGNDIVQGRECTKVLWDPSSSTIGESVSPFILSIDLSETLLVWKVISCIPLDSAEPKVISRLKELGHLETLTLNAGGKRFLHRMETLVLDATRRDRVWLPLRGSIKFVYKPMTYELTMTADESNITLGQALGSEVFTVSSQPETIVYDEVSNRLFVLDPGRGVVSNAERRLEEALMKTGKQFNMSPSNPPEAPQPVYEATCGSLALYFFLRLRGSPISLTAIAELLPPVDTAVSLDDLASVGRRFGGDLIPVSVVSKATIPEGLFIAHISKRQGSPSAPQDQHFVVAKENGKTIYLIAEGRDILQVPKKDFLAAWTGYALVQPSNSTEARMGLPYFTWRSLIVVGLGGVALLTLGILFCRGRLKKRVATTLGGALLCGILSNCDGRADRTAAFSDKSQKPSIARTQTPSLKCKPSTFEFGLISEGDRVEPVFEIANVSFSRLTLGVRGSCGVRGPHLEHDELKPGDATRLTARIDTLGRTGGVQEYIDLYSEGNKLETLWIAGQVKSLVHLGIAPAVIEVGSVKIGSTFAWEIRVDCVSSEPSMMPDLSVAVVGIEAPLSVTCDWGSWEGETGRGGSEGYSYVMTRKGRVKAIASRVGGLNDIAIQCVARDKGKTIRALGNIALTGRVFGKFWWEPEIVYLGSLTTTESREFSVRLHVDECNDQAIQIAEKPDSMTITSITRCSDGFEIHGSLSGVGQESGLVRKSLGVRIGEETSRIGIVGCLTVRRK